MERKWPICRKFKAWRIPCASTHEARRLLLGPLTALTGVRFPLGLPADTLEQSRVFFYPSGIRLSQKYLVNRVRGTRTPGWSSRSRATRFTVLNKPGAAGGRNDRAMGKSPSVGRLGWAGWLGSALPLQLTCPSQHGSGGPRTVLSRPRPTRCASAGRGWMTWSL